MDKHDFFVRTAEHLAQQREQCVRPDSNRCQYTDLSGNHCALGVHMTEKDCVYFDQVGGVPSKYARILKYELNVSPGATSAEQFGRSHIEDAKGFVAIFDGTGLSLDMLDRVQRVHDAEAGRTLEVRTRMLRNLHALATEAGCETRTLEAIAAVPLHEFESEAVS